MSIELLNALVAAANNNVMLGELLRRFCQGNCGAQYGVDFNGRVMLTRQIWECCAAGRGRQASLFPEMLAVCEGILSVPAAAQGVVAEFGCWNGFSTACLSHACKLTRRKYLVFDTFAGLPEGGVVRHIGDMEKLNYKPGEYGAGLESVRAVVAQHGAIDVCEFVPGIFSQTLPPRVDDRYVCVFEDADLVPSVQSVLDWAWPRLQFGCKFFSHEARDLEVMQLFFDQNYWRSKHGTAAPGVVGSGIGLPLCINEGDKSSYLLPLGSCLTYALKRPN
jgi:hypothetical protein